MSLRILIVDDLSFMRNAIREIIEAQGFEVAGEAANGEAGVQLYEETHPDVVLMDITMPVLDGIESLRRIIKLDEGAKVVMCSALGQQEHIVRAIQFGAKDFVIKPFRPERIVSAVRKAAKVHESLFPSP